MSHRCPGCSAVFVSTAGRMRHLSQSKDPRCNHHYRSSSSWLPLPSPQPLQLRETDTRFTSSSSSSLLGSFAGIDQDIEMADRLTRDEIRDAEGPTQVDDMEIDSEEEGGLGSAWEVPEHGPTTHLASDEPDEPDDYDDDRNDNMADSQPHHPQLQDNLRLTPEVIHFCDIYPESSAGQTILAPDGSDPTSVGSNNPWAPFNGPMDAGIATWAKMRGQGSTAFSELLQIDGLAGQLGLSYKNSRELNQIIDTQLTTSRPRFVRHEIFIAGESYDVYFRDVIECVRALWGDSSFAPYLVYSPERHYMDKDQTMRAFHEMHTGKWWWETQKELDRNTPGGTIIPLIVSTDRTQLTVFGNKQAYPIYLTIGNIPKEMRRKPSCHAQVLLGYLPTTTLGQVASETRRRRMVANLFHACMRKIFAPLEVAGQNGVAMRGGNGEWRRCHPILAVYAADYPEQCLAACTKSGSCPICSIHPNDIGKDTTPHPRRDLSKIKKALKTSTNGPTEYSRACAAAGIKPVQHPFWEKLPYTNIYHSVTPDILHQVNQGLIKYIIAWVQEAYGTAEIDARCCRLPPNHNIRIFMNGISALSRVTGKEHSQISSTLLGLVIDAQLPDGFLPGRLVRACRAILDFSFLAQFPLHTTASLKDLTAALERFHENKDIFEDLGIRENYLIPKLHSFDHYLQSIMNLGTTDNYNTEYTERLHIDTAKLAYRATNHKDEFPQMTVWLERREKMIEYQERVKWRLAGCPLPPLVPAARTVGVSFQQSHRMAKEPSETSIDLSTITEIYSASQFKESLAEFVAMRQSNGTQSWQQIQHAASSIDLSAYSFSVYHFIKFTIHNPFQTPPIVIVDAIHAKPARTNARGQTIPARFDTALVSVADGMAIGKEGHRVAQVHVVFSLPRRLIDTYLTHDKNLPKYLAYVEFFTKFPAQPEPNHLLYCIKRDKSAGGEPVSRIVSVGNIRRSVHLFPKFGPAAPVDWSPSQVLQQSSTFFLNTMSDRHMYYIFS